MCGRFTLHTRDRTPLKGLVLDLSFEPRYNIAPSQEIIAIADFGNGPEVRSLVWGLIPSWSKDAKGFINARAETLEDKPSFSESFESRRCLIPADGFYEWKRSGKWKQPYYFQLKDEAPFAFAGIWDEWRGDQMKIRSCAIITSIANELLAPIHDRMPVILHPESYETWLTGDAKREDLRSYLLPYRASEMKSHPVSSDVNEPKTDRPDLVKRVEESIGENLSLF